MLHLSKYLNRVKTMRTTQAGKYLKERLGDYGGAGVDALESIIRDPSKDDQYRINALYVLGSERFGVVGGAERFWQLAEWVVDTRQKPPALFDVCLTYLVGLALTGRAESAALVYEYQSESPDNRAKVDDIMRRYEVAVRALGLAQTVTTAAAGLN